MTNSNTLLPTSAQPDAEGFRRYRIAPSGIGSAEQSNSVTSEYGSDSNTIFDDDRLPGSNLVRPITVGGKQYKYVQWGYDDQLPYRLRREIMSNMIRRSASSSISCHAMVRACASSTARQSKMSPILTYCSSAYATRSRRYSLSRLRI